MLRFIPIALILSLLFISAQSSSVAAQQALIRQKILPLDCVFEIMDSESGSIRYITPDECGVPPSPPVPTLPPIVNDPQTPPSEQVGIDPLEQQAPIRSAFLEPLDIVISDFTAARSYQSVLVKAMPGQTIHFRIPDRELAPEYQTWTITIVDIDDSSMRLSASSQTSELSINLGQTMQFDIDSDGQQDINLSLEEVDPHNSANLRFWLVHDEVDASSSSHRGFNIWSYAAVLAGAAMVIYVLRRKGSALV